MTNEQSDCGKSNQHERIGLWDSKGRRQESVGAAVVNGKGPASGGISGGEYQATVHDVSVLEFHQAPGGARHQAFCLVAMNRRPGVRGGWCLPAPVSPALPMLSDVVGCVALSGNILQFLCPSVLDFPANVGPVISRTFRQFCYSFATKHCPPGVSRVPEACRDNGGVSQSRYLIVCAIHRMMNDALWPWDRICRAPSGLATRSFCDCQPCN